MARRTVLSPLAGGAFVLLSGWAALVALLVAGMTCDDTCAGTEPPPGTDWTRYSEATQWTEIGVLAGVNVVVALASTALTLLQHRRPAGLLVLLFTATSVRLVAMLNETGGSYSWYVWFLASALGVVTVLVAGRR